MDSINFDNVKAEKAKALRRYNRFRRIGRFFRAAEVCVAILFILWTFTRLPFAVQISREFLRRIAGVISTPLFVFLFANCIVVALLTKSSSVEENRGSSNAETEIYEALVRSKPSYGEELADDHQIVYDDKEMIVVTDSDPSNNIIPQEGVEEIIDSVSDEPKVYGRSKSQVVSRRHEGSADDDHIVLIPTPSSLQRSETEKCMRLNNNSWEDNNNTNNYEEDNLSNEEFQKTIEAFIAKQRMFRRQESLAVVVHNNKP